MDTMRLAIVRGMNILIEHEMLSMQDNGSAWSTASIEALPKVSSPANLRVLCSGSSSTQD